jgi:hypothetical protein
MFIIVERIYVPTNEGKTKIPFFVIIYGSIDCLI